MDYLNEIREMMAGANLDSIDFLWQYNKPTITREGIKHEILTIHAPEKDENELVLTTIPRTNWKLFHLIMTPSWRSSSWRHIRNLVKREIARMEEEC